MKITVTKEVADAINTLKNICKKNPDSCQGCPFWDRYWCILDYAPADWPEIVETKTYSIEVDTDE